MAGHDLKGDLETAPEHAACLLARDLAMAQAIEVLRVCPGSIAAIQILGGTMRLQGRIWSR